MTNDDGSGQKNQPMQNPMQTLGGNILIMTDPSHELYRIELTMRNLFLNADGELCKVGGDDWKPLLNENGIRRVLGLIESLVARNSIMSHVDEEEIKRMMIFNADTLIKELMQSRRYGIVNNTARDTILTQSMNLMFMTLKRAMKGGERVFLKGSQQEVTYRTEQNTQKKGLWDRVSSFGG